jgi:hypothetical protein
LHADKNGSQVGIHASDSNTLFFPSNNVVHSYPYILSDIPSNTAYSHSFSHHLLNTYIPVNRAHLSQPLFPPPQQFNKFSLYNNLNFVPPPFYPQFSQQGNPVEHPPQFSNNSVPSSIPSQYIYYVSSSQAPVSKTLPSVAHIPLLTSKVDFFA